VTIETLTDSLHKAFEHLVEAAWSSQDGWAHAVLKDQGLWGPKMREVLDMRAGDFHDDIVRRFAFAAQSRGHDGDVTDGLLRLTHPTDGRDAYIYVSGDALAVPMGTAFACAYGGDGE
jgi:hypothetical protein